MAKTVDQLLEEARGKLARLTPEEAFEAQRAGALIVDTRTYEQRLVQGEIPGARVIDRTVFEWRLDPRARGGSPRRRTRRCASWSSATRGSRPAWPLPACTNSA